MPSSISVVGAVRSAQLIQVSEARELSGSTAYTSTAVVELVRNAAVIWPNPLWTAIARPAAARLPARYSSDLGQLGDRRGEQGGARRRIRDRRADRQPDDGERERLPDEAAAGARDRPQGEAIQQARRGNGPADGQDRDDQHPARRGEAAHRHRRRCDPADHPGRREQQRDDALGKASSASSGTTAMSVARACQPATLRPGGGGRSQPAASTTAASTSPMVAWLGHHS